MTCGSYPIESSGVMNSIILARVSTREQEDGHNIDAQISRLQPDEKIVFGSKTL